MPSDLSHRPYTTDPSDQSYRREPNHRPYDGDPESGAHDLRMRAALRDWILKRAKDLDREALTDRTPIFEQRLLTSIHVPELLLLLERLRGEFIDVENLRPGDFRDIDTMVARSGAGGEPCSAG